MWEDPYYDELEEICRKAEKPYLDFVKQNLRNITRYRSVSEIFRKHITRVILPVLKS